MHLFTRLVLVFLTCDSLVLTARASKVRSTSSLSCLAYDDLVHASMIDFDLSLYQGLWYVASTNGKFNIIGVFIFVVVASRLIIYIA